MIRKLLVVNFIYLFLTVSSAHAYLDPGTGSIILQGIIAALAAGAVFVKIYWYKLLTLLGIKKKVDIEDKKNPEN
jgi:hypothetical protein|tara:strand:+ start:50 stop:274 length:225 start_codon:yes stop_codon:yes gene_type:complete